MAAILNSNIMNLAILDSATLVFPLKLTHTCQNWFPPFAQKKNLLSFILTQLDDGSHLEFCHVGFRHCHLRFRHLLIFSQIHSKTFSLHSDSWLKLNQSDSNFSFSLNLMMAAILNLAILDSAIIVFPLKLTHTCQDWFPPSAQKNLHSFILTQLDDGSLLEFYHVGFRHCHFRFRHLLIFSQIHSKTLSLHSDSWLKLNQSDQTYSFSLTLMMAAILNLAILDSAIIVFPLKLTHTCQDWFPPSAQKNLHSFILTQLDDGSYLKLCHVGFRHLVFFSQIYSKTLSLHSDSDSNQFNLTQTHSFSLNLMMADILNFAILDSAILVFPPKLTHTCQDWFPPFAHKKPSLIHSDSTWWWQPSWILPCWIQTLPSWIQTPSYLLSYSLKNTLTPFWLLTQTNSIWLKLIHSPSTWWW